MPNPIMIPADPAPALAKGFANIADVFAPPSARDAYYGTEAGLARAKMLAETQKAQRLADVFANRDNPDQAARDRAAISAGLYNPNQGYYALDQGDATKRFGITTESGDRRYGTDVGASTSRANNTADNDRALKVAIMAPLGEGQSRTVDPGTAATQGVPQQQNGGVKLNPGQTFTMPPGPAGAGSPADAGVPAPTVLQGNPQIQTEEQVKGGILAAEAAKDAELKAAIARGAVPARPVYGYQGGTAQVDPVKGTLNNTQDKAPLPVGTKATNLGAPTTTVNVGDNGATYGTPPKDMAWAHNPDGTIKTDERGAPVAVKIGGSAMDSKDQQTLDKKAEAEKQRTTSGNIVTQDVDRALAAIDTDPTLTTGAGSQITGGIGGSPAKDLKGLLDSIRANVGFDRLQQMRASSPTGGALGQVSDKENALLQSVLGSLDQSQGPTQLKANLKRVKDVTLDIVHGPGQGPARSNEPTVVNKEGHRLVLRGGQWVSE